MFASQNALQKWVPIEGIPPTLPSELTLVTGTAGSADVTLKFDHEATERYLVLRFKEVAALQAFEEFADAFWGPNFSLRFANYALWTVAPSAWLAEFSNFTLSRSAQEYVHYCLGGFDGTLHILAAGEPLVAWTDVKN